MAGTKTWIVNSSRSRHPELNGEEVPLFEAFSNGMQYPGDPAGGTDQTAGCTCTLHLNMEAKEWTNEPSEPIPLNWQDQILNPDGFLIREEDLPAWARRARDQYVVNDTRTLAINQKLRLGQELAVSEMRIVNGVKKLSKQYETTQDGVMWRTAVLREEQIPKAGSVFSDAAPMSASPYHEIALDYGTSRVDDIGDELADLVTFKLEVPGGSTVARMDTTESVFAPGSRWFVTNVSDNTVTMRLLA